MKKLRNILGIISCLIIVFILSGCGSSEEEKIITCNTYKKDVINNYELTSTYKIYSKGDIVNKVETTEIVNSDDETIIDYFEETLNNSYKAMNENYGGYDYNITRETGKVTSITSINYNEMDLEQLATDDASIKSIVNEKNKITVEGIKSLYKQMGAECE